MKNYSSPELTELSSIEGIYADSGSYHMDPPPEDGGDDDGWNIRCEWRNHNTGHHSELAIIGEHHGKLSGESMTMNMRVDGFRLDYIKDCGGMIVTNVSESGFTITRHNHFNATERFEFNIQITCKNSPYEGSVGKTGEYCPHKVHCVSYFTA